MKAKKKYVIKQIDWYINFEQIYLIILIDTSNSILYLVDDDYVGDRKSHGKQIDHLPQHHYNAEVENYPVAVMFDESEM